MNDGFVDDKFTLEPWSNLIGTFQQQKKKLK